MPEDMQTSIKLIMFYDGWLGLCRLCFARFINEKGRRLLAGLRFIRLLMPV